MNVDAEISDVEQRLAQRRLKVELLVHATGRRVMKRVVSPAGLLGAAALGFFVVTRVARRQQPPPVARTRGGKLAGLAGLLASGAFAIVRAQFGGPLQIAHLLLSKLKK